MAVDIQAAATALRVAFPEAKVSVEPSVVAGSSYDYVYVYLTDAGPDGPHLLVSDLREWEPRSAYIVGFRRNWDDQDEAQEYTSISEVVARCQTLVGEYRNGS